MPTSRPCLPRRLAAHGPIRIDLCSCGQIHLSIGATTVRLAQPLARALGEALRTALARLDQATPPPPALQ
jgi:hypothetical protein